MCVLHAVAGELCSPLNPIVRHPGGAFLPDTAPRHVLRGTVLYQAYNNTYGVKSISEAQYNAMVAETPTCISMINKCQEDTTECPAAQAECNNAQMGYVVYRAYSARTEDWLGYGV